MKDYLLDSNTVIYYLNKPDLDYSVVSAIKENKTWVSSITKLEVLGWRGISQIELSKALIFFDFAKSIAVSDILVSTAISIRRTFGLKSVDSIIAATSIYHNIPLITFDKEFKKVEGLNLFHIDSIN